jgi:hypothetical protein
MVKKKKDPTAQKRVQRYRLRQSQRGMRNVTVFVPNENVDEIKLMARKMREKASKDGA